MTFPGAQLDATTDLAAGEAAEKRGDLTEAAAGFARAAASADATVHARGLIGLGRISWRQARLDDALAHYAAARSIAEEQNALDLLAEVENGCGAVHYARGEYDRARTAFRASLALTDDDTHRAKVALNLGVLANIAGDRKEAEQQYRDSLQAFRRSGDRGGEALALHNLAMLHADRRDWDAADLLFAECLAHAEAAGNRQLIADTLLNRSEVLCGQGQHAEAAAVCDQAISMHDELGDVRGRGEALRWQGHAYGALGELGRAEACLVDAHRIARSLRNALLEAETVRELGALAERRGDTVAAIEWLRQARTLFSKLGAARDVADVTARLGRATTHGGRRVTPPSP